MRIKILQFENNIGPFYVAYGFSEAGELIAMEKSFDGPLEAEMCLRKYLSTAYGKKRLIKFSEHLPCVKS